MQEVGGEERRAWLHSVSTESQLTPWGSLELGRPLQSYEEMRQWMKAVLGKGMTLFSQGDSQRRLTAEAVLAAPPAPGGKSPSDLKGSLGCSTVTTAPPR